MDRLEDKKHKYCQVCLRRLDNVKNMRFSKIEGLDIIKKLNFLKPGIEAGHNICSRCAQSARSKFKDIDIAASNQTMIETETENLIESNCKFFYEILKILF